MAQPPASAWETIMRFSPAAIASAVILVTVSSASMGAPPQPAAPISATSRAMQSQADALQRAGDLDAATGFYETALAADPRNADAYIGLAMIARAQDLPGKAVGYYREALALAPDNRDVIAAQGEALIARGAVEKARQNLARLNELCGRARCPQAARLTQAINAAGERTALRPAEILPQPVVEAAPAAPAAIPATPQPQQ